MICCFQLEIGWDNILQEDSNRGMFDMELEDAVKGTMDEGGEVGLRVFLLFMQNPET